MLRNEFSPSCGKVKKKNYTIDFSGNYDKEALSVNDKIMNTIYNIAVMWPLALAILSLVVVSITLIICYKYSECYLKLKNVYKI